jgi:glycine cleavage system H protein
MSHPDDRKYTKDHEWIRLSGNAAEVGITSYAQEQLGDVVYVELPDVGAQVTAGQPFGSIESVKAVSELFAPLSGQVTEINDQVRHHPETVNSDPYGTWIVRLDVSNPGEAGALLDSQQYQALLG